jgi:hypothetical protein
MINVVIQNFKIYSTKLTTILHMGRRLIALKHFCIINCRVLKFVMTQFSRLTQAGE